MSEMVERVAKAFYEKMYDGWQELPTEWPPMCADDFRAATRAAIAATHEPTDAMVEAGKKAVVMYNENYVGLHVDVSNIWRAMNAAALGD